VMPTASASALIANATGLPMKRRKRRARRATSVRNAIRRRPPNVKCAAIVSAITTLVEKIKSHQIYARAVSVRRKRMLSMATGLLSVPNVVRVAGSAMETARSLNKSSN